MKLYKWINSAHGNECFESLQDIVDEINAGDSMEIGETILIEVCELTQEEYDNLPKP